MAKIKVKVKSGTKGKPLGVRVAELRAEEGKEGKELYRPKAKITAHLKPL